MGRYLSGLCEWNRIHKTDHRNGKKKLFKLEILYAHFPLSVAFKISDVLKRLKLLIYWRSLFNKVSVYVINIH